MKRWLAFFLATAATSGAAFGDAQVSLDVQAMAASSPIDVPTVGARTSALVMGANGATAGGVNTTGASPSDAIVGVEVRPSFAFSRGFRVGVGFRAGRGATVGDSVDLGTTSMWGGDLSVGFQKWFGRLMPYVEARFGFNAYSIELPGGGTQHADQLRLDGVLGARVYFGNAFYLAASAFGGWGDRYGGTVGLGWDVIRYRSRGVMP